MRARAHTQCSSQLVLFQSLVTPSYRPSLPWPSQCPSGPLLGQAKATRHAAELLWSICQVQRASGECNSRQFRSGTRLGCCQKFMFTLANRVNIHTNYWIVLSVPGMSTITVRSKWNTIFYWNRSQAPHAVSPSPCRQIWCVHISRERTPLRALTRGRKWKHLAAKLRRSNSHFLFSGTALFSFILDQADYKGEEGIQWYRRLH